jgi:hypothetical protein
LGQRRAVSAGMVGRSPQPETAEKRVGVISSPATGRQLIKVLHIPAAQDHFVGLQCCSQPGNYVEDALPPLLFAESLQAAYAHIVFVGPLPIRKVAKFHRLHDAIDDERCAQTGAQT